MLINSFTGTTGRSSSMSEGFPLFGVVWYIKERRQRRQQRRRQTPARLLFTRHDNQRGIFVNRGTRKHNECSSTKTSYISTTTIVRPTNTHSGGCDGFSLCAHTLEGIVELVWPQVGMRTHAVRGVPSEHSQSQNSRCFTRRSHCYIAHARFRRFIHV